MVMGRDGLLYFIHNLLQHSTQLEFNLDNDSEAE